MIQKTDIEALREIFIYGDATSTHLNIIDYLNTHNVPRSEYLTWNKNASQQAVQADADYDAIARRDFERGIYEQCDLEDNKERTA